MSLYIMTGNQVTWPNFYNCLLFRTQISKKYIGKYDNKYIYRYSINVAIDKKTFKTWVGVEKEKMVDLLMKKLLNLQGNWWKKIERSDLLVEKTF